MLAATARVTRDLDLAEECVQDAYADALDAWTRDGIPASPGAWLTTAARRRALDALRRDQTAADEAAAAGRAGGGGPRRIATPARTDPRRPAPAGLHLLPPGAGPGGAGRADPAAGLRPDDRRHRAGVPGVRADHGGPGHPGEEEDRRRPGSPTGCPPRPSCRTGSTPPSPSSTCSSPPVTPHRPGPELIRDDLVDARARPGRMLPRPDAGRAGGPRAARAAAAHRRPPGHPHRPRDGRLLLLEEQDRSRWDREAIAEAHDLVLGALRGGRPAGSPLQAAIAALHAEAPTYGDTDWRADPGASTTSCCEPGRRRWSRSTGPWRWRWSTARQAALAEVEALGQDRPTRRLPLPAGDQGRPAAPAGPQGRRRRGVPTGDHAGRQRRRTRLPRRPSRVGT